MEITNLVQTCGACPSQWEALTDDGRGVYVRYRWGYLSICVSNQPGEHGLEGREVYSVKMGDNLDGLIDWEVVAPIIGSLQLDV